MIVNMRSDTQTLPTAEMRQAMAEAELGDETYREDPTVLQLEELVASMFEREAAMLVLSGTMANLIALKTHCRPGDEVFTEARTHVVRAEAGGYASIAGVVMTHVESHRGHMLPESLRSAAHATADYLPRPRLAWLENTNNQAGGTVMPLTQFDSVVATARECRLSVHLDGSRVFNAALASDAPAARLARGVDSIYMDLTKGLSCPLGSLLVGSADFIEEARFQRRSVGGGMRQAGVIAACGLVAIETLIDRLADDHQLASWMAARIAEIDGYIVDPQGVDTNIVNVDVRGLGHSADVAAALRDEGLIVSERPPSAIRLVTHRHIDETSARAALESMRRVADKVRPTGQTE